MGSFTFSIRVFFFFFYGASPTPLVPFNSRVNLCSHSFYFLVSLLGQGMFDTESISKLCDRNMQNAFTKKKKKSFLTRKMLVMWAEADEFHQFFPWVIKLHIQVDCFLGEWKPISLKFFKSFKFPCIIRKHNPSKDKMLLNRTEVGNQIFFFKTQIDRCSHTGDLSSIFYVTIF